LHILATILGIPGVVLTIAGGIGFGLVWGTVWSTLGATLGAMGAFGLARSLLHDPIQTRFGHHPLLAKLNRAVAHHPLNFVLMIRFAPISPFNVVNFLFGLTRIPWQSYSLGTLVGIIPGVIAYTWLGVAGHTALYDHNPVPLLLAGSLLALLSALPLLFRPLKSL
ncbi:MAG: TVP38/TMEM64 family protein, partial [Thermosynechococcaceae cyanobacterium]